MLFNILALSSLLIVLLMLRRLVGVFPSLMACLIRAKENINLESSVQLSRDRDILSLTMIIPFCLTVWKYGLYSPSFVSECNDNIQMCIIAGVLLAVIILRKALGWIFHSPKINGKVYSCASKAVRTFFSLLTLVLLACGWIMSSADAPAEAIKSAMLWISAAIYLIFLIRKTQILSSSSSFFVAFLYLCALEIIPTGAIIASAIIL